MSKKVQHMCDRRSSSERHNERACTRDRWSEVVHKSNPPRQRILCTSAMPKVREILKVINIIRTFCDLDGCKGSSSATYLVFLTNANTSGSRNPPASRLLPP